VKARIFLLLIAAAHVVFLYVSYGTGMFHLPLPAAVKTALWLGGSSLAAGVAYFKVASTIPGIASRKNAFVFSGLATCVSLYAGGFLAFNAFGT
jgi:hypothetical protein